MLKEVGASGQISLGKKYAGQLFDLTVQADGSIVMRPVKVVPAAEIEQYNAWATQREPYSKQVANWRKQKAAEKTGTEPKP